MTHDAPWRRLVVVEANEIPRRVLDEHIRREPGSALARLVEQGHLIETEVTEKLHRELYPSQTWYSMNSGVPYEEHQVFWYGDPKPAEHPLYWQVASRAGRSVGVVNTLHSSPLAQQCAEGKYAFVIPDCFAESPDTKPAKYQRFQELNLELTNESGRNASVKPRLSYLGTGATLPLLGVRPTTIARVGAMAAKVAAKRMNKERLRIAQSMLLSDMFMKLCRKHDPDLAVYFTNHVASAMHRYWYALFPDDWTEAHYSDEWVSRYRDEIPAAMRALDAGIADMWSWCEATDRTLVLLTSMGQRPTSTLDTSTTGTAIVRDPVRFAEALGVSDSFTVGSAMVPQIHYSFETEEIAAVHAAAISALDTGPADIRAERSGAVVTVIYHLGDLADGTISLGGVARPISECGISWEKIDDHRSGAHDPMGLMLVAGYSLARDLPAVVDALDVAPMLLSALGVAPVGSMRVPQAKL